MQRSICLAVALLLVLNLSAFAQTVIATVHVGSQPMYLAVDQERDRVYVTNQADNTVSVINGKSHKVIATIPVGKTPNGIAVDPQTNTAYIANFRGSSISMIDLTTLKSTKISVGPSPAKIAVNSATKRIYVTLENLEGGLAVIDGASGKLLTTVHVPSYPLSVVVNPRNNRILVGDFLCGCGQITIVDGSTNKVRRTITVPGTTELDGIALDQDDHNIYVTDENSGFYVVNEGTGQLVGSVNNLSSPNEVSSIHKSMLAVEPDTGSNSAIFIDTSSMTIRAQVPVGNFPTGVAVDSRRGKVYVANRNDGTVSVISLN
jgi:YVTN family beta-propeller protein